MTKYTFSRRLKTVEIFEVEINHDVWYIVHGEPFDPESVTHDALEEYKLFAPGGVEDSLEYSVAYADITLTEKD